MSDQIVKTTSTLSGWKLKLARSLWWIVFILFAVFRIFELQNMLPTQGGNFWSYLFTVVYFSLSTISILLSILLYWKKSSEWISLLVSMMFISFVQDGYSFWIWFLGQGWFSTALPNPDAIAVVASNLAQIFQFISWTIFLAAFLNFPTGQWIFPKVYWVIIVWAMLYWLPSLLEATQIGQPGILGAWGMVLFVTSLMAAGILQWVHYFKIPDPAQRQQVKWIVFFFVVSILFDNFVTVPVALITGRSNLPGEVVENIYYITNSITTILVIGWMMAFSIAIFRYRLWDIDGIINRAMVYSLLTGLLVLIGIASVTGIDFFIAKIVGEKSTYLATLIAALPVAAAFNPLLKRLQGVVDKRFKPEVVDFSDTFIEFTPPVLERLAINDLAQILANQATKQLNLDTASVYMRQPDGQFTISASSLTKKQPNTLELNKKQLGTLENGKMVTVESTSPFSLLVPLVVPRASIPDLLGILALGIRLKGTGYSTQTLKNIQSLGGEPRKAICLSTLLKKENHFRMNLLSVH